MESEPTVTTAKYFNPAEGHAARMALEEAAIPAWVIDEVGGSRTQTLRMISSAKPE